MSAFKSDQLQACNMCETKLRVLPGRAFNKVIAMGSPLTCSVALGSCIIMKPHNILIIG